MQLNELELKLSRRVQTEIKEEYTGVIDELKSRQDYSVSLDYFLNMVSWPLDFSAFRERFDKPLAGLYCIQLPLEIFDAMGFTPVRLCASCSSVHRLSAANLPALACPVIKSCAAAFYLEDSPEKLCDVIIIPTTCDWNSKFAELIPDKTKPVYIMEMPRTRQTERSQKRWLEEVYELKRFLQLQSKSKFSRKQLLSSIEKYTRASEAFSCLIELRRAGRISGIWSIIIANAFMMDKVESWTEQLNMFLKNYDKSLKNNKPAVFLAGSPVSFPSLKICSLIEEAGMYIQADELCSSERIMTGVPVYKERSEYGLIKALADRYSLGCSCPVYADNDRRIDNIIGIMRKYNIKGVVYHQLKGCHPYDMESFRFEKMIKENGFHFLKIETDYSKEDKQNILARLEAFRETL